MVVAPRALRATPAGPIWFRNDDDGPVEADLIESLDHLDGLLDELAGLHAVSRRQLVLGGFSQGGAVALAAALRAAGAADALGGVFAISAWLPHAEAVAYDAAALAAAATPALVVHGVDDDVVALPQGRSAARYLERHGVPVDLVEIDGDHHLGTATLGPLARWLDAMG